MHGSMNIKLILSLPLKYFVTCACLISPCQLLAFRFTIFTTESFLNVGSSESQKPLSQRRKTDA
jgi:hypothetical protein